MKWNKGIKKLKKKIWKKKKKCQKDIQFIKYEKEK